MSYCLRVVSAIGVLALGLMGAAPATAVVLTFEELPHDGELQGAGPTVLSKGFTLQYTPAPDEPYPVGLFTVGPTWRFNGRSAALAANSCSATTRLSADDNNPLTLLSIDIAGLNGDTNVVVAFVGITSEGATVQRSIQLRDQPGWQRFHFPGAFHKLQSVSWTQGDCINNFPHMFDNIRVLPSWKGKNDD